MHVYFLFFFVWFIDILSRYLNTRLEPLQRNKLLEMSYQYSKSYFNHLNTINKSIGRINIKSRLQRSKSLQIFIHLKHFDI